MAPIAFQIMSDLHLETHPSYDFDVKFSAPYLALLGDIGHCGDGGLYKFLERQLKRYWVVFFLLGNHEPTHQSWLVAKERVQAFAARVESLRARTTIGRFVFLDRTRYDLTPSITILGCTLFSQVGADQAAEVSRRLVDFTKIREWDVSDHNSAHEGDRAWLNEQVKTIEEKEPTRQVVIFTHHCPTADERALDPRYKNSGVSQGFVVDLRGEPCWVSKTVIMWAFGHTHWSCDFEDEYGKRVVANQKGYHGAPEKAFELKKSFMVGRD